MITDEDQELLDEFCEEARELLEDTDEAFVALEATPDDSEIINKIFRAVHTIKGNSAYFGLVRIKDFSHAVEGVLDDLRKGIVQADRELIDSLLAARDHLGFLLSRITDLDSVPEDNDRELLDVLAAGSKQTPTQSLDSINKLLSGIEAEIGELDPSEHSAIQDAITKARRLTSRGADQQEKVASSRPSTPQSNSLATAESSRSGSKRSMRIDESKIDSFLEGIGELLNLVEMYSSLQRKLESGLDLNETTKDMKLSNRNFQEVADRLQADVMEIRQVPIRGVMNKLNRIVRDTARGLGKEVHVDLKGADQLIDKSYVEIIEGPLVHMVRNAIDHGIETPEQRGEAGKPTEGKVEIEYHIAKDHYEVNIRDDGKGMDHLVLRQKAVEKGLMSQAEADSLTKDAALQIVFMPGFSTATEVTEVSGRGVGMDVVISSVSAAGGKVKIESEPGKGSIFRISLPRSLANVVVSGLLVRIAESSFIIPMEVLRETIEIRSCEKTQLPNGTEMITVRGKPIPFIRLADRLSLKPKTQAKHAVIVSHRDQEAAVEINEALGLQKVVVKRMEDQLLTSSRIRGGAILGDGSVGMVLDFANLL